MCEYVNLNKCCLTNDICPYMYLCNRTRIYKPSKYMPENCKVKNRANEPIPDGYYRVRQYRNGYLYVDIDGQTYKIKNPFDDIPRYVKVRRLKNGEWRLKK